MQQSSPYVLHLLNHSYSILHILQPSWERSCIRKSCCLVLLRLPKPQILPSIPHYLQKACDEQALIGRDQLISGRLAYTWGTTIATYLHQQKCDPTEMTALTWGRKFVGLMYDLVLKIWNQRNTDVHFSNMRHDSKLTRDRLMANIEAMQNSNPDIQHQDRVYVYRSLETLETYSLLTLQAWNRMAKNIIAANKKGLGSAGQRGRTNRGGRGGGSDGANPRVARD
jgi:hypothetical protein